MRIRSVENAAFLLLVAVTSGLFVWLIYGLLQPVLWAAVLAIVFHGLEGRWLRWMRGRENLATALNLLTIVLMVIVPLGLIGLAVAREAAGLFQRIASGELDVQAPLRALRDALPVAGEELERFGIDVEGLERGLSSAAMSASRWLASHAFAIGQDALRTTALFFLMLYVLFFFLRDGPRILDAMVERLPLGDTRERQLFARFAQVARATIKGTLIVGAVQGGLGGVTFWLLGISAPAVWGVIMTVLSILPAVGASLVWVPTAIFLFVSGQWVRATILLAVGTFVIGLVDNLLRPILVGRDTRMPDYLILLSTLGGLSLFGLAGFVIGPLIAALFLTVWDMFSEEYNRQAPAAPEARPDDA